MTSETFKSVVNEWYDPLYRFAISLCGDADAALDLTQNAFHKLAKNWRDIREPSKVKSWLFSVLHRDFIDQYRRKKRVPFTGLDQVAEPPAHDPIPRGTGVDVTSMMNALLQMDEKFRAPLSLFYIESLSYKEIADVLDIPIGTVMSRLRRAKDQLRERLESGDGTEQNDAVSSPIPFRKEARNG